MSVVVIVVAVILALYLQRWWRLDSKRARTAPRGLFNRGKDCAVISVLQLLARSSIVRRSLAEVSTPRTPALRSLVLSMTADTASEDMLADAFRETARLGLKAHELHDPVDVLDTLLAAFGLRPSSLGLCAVALSTGGHKYVSIDANLPPAAIVGGLASTPVWVLYPLAKRVTDWPQAVLGVAMNWGAVLGWVAVHGEAHWPVVLPLYAGSLLWTLHYDTIYAYQARGARAPANAPASEHRGAERRPRKG